MGANMDNPDPVKCVRGHQPKCGHVIPRAGHACSVAPIRQFELYLGGDIDFCEQHRRGRELPASQHPDPT